MENPRIENIKSRYKEISNLIQGDEAALKMLSYLEASAGEYVKSVAWDEILANRATLSYDGESYRASREKSDRNRRYSHDALISNLHIFTRYLTKNYPNAPVGGIYTFEPRTMETDRTAVGDWASDLIFGLKEMNQEVNKY